VTSYDMICKAGTLGVFQIEGRAQMDTITPAFNALYILDFETRTPRLRVNNPSATNRRSASGQDDMVNKQNRCFTCGMPGRNE
jgi:hypothetical protein